MKHAAIIKSIFATVVFVALGAWADTETVDGYTWTYRINGDTAEIYNNGSAAISPSPTGAVTIPSALGGKPVTRIGSYAFYYCSGLTSVTIPDSVTGIGSLSFWGCGSLARVTIPSSVTTIGNSAFYKCSSLTSMIVPASVSSISAHMLQDCAGLKSVTIPDSVTSIGYQAFEGCGSLTNIVIPGSVKSIEGRAFTGCSTLTSVIIPEGLTSIASSTFSGCAGLTSLIIPSNVTNIGLYAFSGCSGLTSVVIPNSVTSTGEGVFSGCSGLTSVDIPDSMTSLERFIFDGCSGLTSMVIPNSVSTICDYAFRDCSGLKSVVIPDSVTDIGKSAFEGCGSLTNVTIPDSVEYIGECAFESCSGLTNVVVGCSVANIGEFVFGYCGRLKRVSIPDSVTNIAAYAFYYCSDLTGIVIPNSITNIRGGTFAHCGSLMSVTIPDSVTSIDGGAFECCSNLMSAIIPDSVTSIGSLAFYRCHGLSDIVIGNSVTNIGTLSFRYCTSLTNVTFMGNAPSVDAYAFESVNADCTAYVSKDSTGWGVKIPGKWNGIFIEYDDWFGVRFNANGGKLPDAESTLVVVPGNSVGTLPVPTRIGYSFDGWFTAIDGGVTISEDTIINERISVYAHWKELDYTISFETQVGEVELSPIIRHYGQPLGELPIVDVERYGYTFSGWADVDEATIVTGDMTLCAVWNRNVYSVSFDAHVEGSEIDDLERFYEDTIGVLPQPTRDGCVFLGWFTDPVDGAEVKETDKVMSDITLHAHWAEGPFNIEVGGAQWSYQTYSGVATIISATANEDSLSIPEMLGGAVVVEIPKACFAQVANLKCLAIPGSVTNIGAYAFCNCTDLEEVVFNEGLEKIGDGAFANCKRLKAVSLPSTVVDLGSKMISNCGCTYVEDGVLLRGTNFVDEAVHDEGGPDDEYEYHSTNITATSAWDYGSSCSFMCSTNIDFVYERNADWVRIVCSTSITSFTGSAYDGRGVFEGCLSLESVSLNAGLRRIGAGAFKDCISLVSLDIPGSVVSIGGHREHVEQTASNAWISVFDELQLDDQALSTLSSEHSVSGYGNNSIYEGSGFVQGCTSMTNIVLPACLSYLGPYSFAGCTNLRGVDLPDSLRTINEGTFSGCSALEIVKLPESLDLIGGYEFTPYSSRVGSIDTLRSNGGTPSTLASDQEISVQYDEDGGVLYSDTLVMNGGRPSCLSRYVKTNVMSNADGTFNVEEILIENNLTTNVTSYVAGYDDIDLDNRWQDGVETVFVPKRRQVVVDSDGCDHLGELMDFIGAKCSGLDGEVMTARRRFYPDAPVYNGKIFAPESGVFFGCRNLRAIVLPDTVRRIADYAFYNCSALETINAPDSLAVVGYRAFGGTTNLPEVGAPWLRYSGWIDDMVDDGRPYDDIADVFDVVRGMVYSVKADLSEEEKLYVARVAASSAIYALEHFCIADPSDPFEGIDNMLAMTAEIFNAVAITDLDSNERSLLIDNVVYCVERLYRRISGSEVNGRTVDVSPINSFSGLGNAMAGLSEVFYSVGRALADEERVRYACVATASAASLLCAVTDEDYPAISLETYEGVGDIYAGLCNVYSNLSAKLSVGRKQELSDEISQAAISANAAMSKSGKPVGSALDDVQFFTGECINYLNNAKDDVIPVLVADTTQEEFASIVEDIRFADSRLPAELLIGTEVYTAFREWAGGVKGATGDALAGEAVVVANEHAAAAYLLGAERLFENEPTVEIGELAIEERASGTLAPTMTVAVTVKDGETAVTVNAEKVAAMFEATGDLGDWNGAAKLTPTVTVEEGDGATMRFKVMPGDGIAPRAFLRIRK